MAQEHVRRVLTAKSAASRRGFLDYQTSPNREDSIMDKLEAISQAQSESAKAGGERRYAVRWLPNPNFPQGHWTVETRKPSLAGECLAAVDGVLEHA